MSWGIFSLGGSAGCTGISRVALNARSRDCDEERSGLWNDKLEHHPLAKVVDPGAVVLVQPAIET